MGHNVPTVEVASAARTTSGDSGYTPVASLLGQDTLILLLDVTAQSGTTPTLDVSVEWSMDGGSTFAPGDTADAFVQIAAATGAKVKDFAIKGSGYRIVWAIAGTSPSYTFAVTELTT
ncbi:hypothetical protein LCGC14_2537720 [marine sediment metagenome]|uniref:Uncharacterized protein n=1 Tax=marine sediment metagenome TaxID=412755 RepID=A0A0F9ARQ4_9ZZZZ